LQIRTFFVSFLAILSYFTIEIQTRSDGILELRKVSSFGFPDNSPGGARIVYNTTTKDKPDNESVLPYVNIKIMGEGGGGIEGRLIKWSMRLLSDVLGIILRPLSSSLTRCARILLFSPIEKRRVCQSENRSGVISTVNPSACISREAKP
jgi:hypothetical protein